MNYKKRLVIADSQRLVAEACQHVLHHEFDVVAIVTDGRALIQAAFSLRPDVVILEISLPQLNGLDAAEQIKQKLPLLQLVFLTATSDVNAVAEAFRRGASAYVLKHSGTEELLAAIRTIRGGKSYLSSQIARETIERLLWQQNRTTSAKRLTRRQTEILQLLAEGRSMKQVAAVLEIAPGTVAFHKYNMMERLGIESNAGLFDYAMRNHMAPAQAV